AGRGGERDADARTALARVEVGADVAVVAGGAVRDRGAGAGAALTGVPRRARSAVVARRDVGSGRPHAGAVLAAFGDGSGVVVVAGGAVDRLRAAGLAGLARIVVSLAGPVGGGGAV